MHKGVSVWLDVPVDALAKRIAAVGTNSRPLLHDEAGDAYTAVNCFASIELLFFVRVAKYNILSIILVSELHKKYFATII